MMPGAASHWQQQRLSACDFSTTAASSSPATPAHASIAPARSFIELAKRHGGASLLGPFPTFGLFDSCLRGLHLTRMDPSGEAEGWMVVDKTVENSWGTLHGGAVATIVDVMGTLALLAKDHSRGGVSVRGDRRHTADNNGPDSRTHGARLVEGICVADLCGCCSLLAALLLCVCAC